MVRIENNTHSNAPGALRDKLIEERGGRQDDEGEGGAATTWKEVVEGRQDSTHPDKQPRDGLNRR